jgi:hypothetical protein
MGHGQLLARSRLKYFLELNYPEKLTHGKDYQWPKYIKVRPLRRNLNTSYREKTRSILGV